MFEKLKSSAESTIQLRLLFGSVLYLISNIGEDEPKVQICHGREGAWRGGGGEGSWCHDPSVPEAWCPSGSSRKESEPGPRADTAGLHVQGQRTLYQVVYEPGSLLPRVRNPVVEPMAAQGY